jgi:actin related protein 2/3 complex subunit 1A/1B
MRSVEIALSNSNQVLIYQLSASTPQLIHTLSQHDQLVTCIDWAPTTNRIVSCSQDRNAYVWSLDDHTWKPTLVLLRINRAATFVRWSPLETKFAVGSSAGSVSICYFEEDNDWWVSKHLKRPIKSTVLSVDWHPNNVLLAVGSSDMRAYVLSAFIKGVDKKPLATAWGEKLPFNTVCGEYVNPAGGWVHAVAFSPSGEQLAYAAHDACVTIVDKANHTQSTVPTRGLAFLTLVWLNEHRLLAAGFDCKPFLFEKSGGVWTCVKSIDQQQRKESQQSGSAFNMFRQMDSRAIASGAKAEDVQLQSVHQNSITMLRPYKVVGDSVQQVSSSAMDGKLVVWAV